MFETSMLIGESFVAGTPRRPERVLKPEDGGSAPRLARARFSRWTGP